MDRLTANNRRLALLKQFATSLAHELNNPLAVIVGKAEQLEQRATSGQLDAPSILNAARKIHANGMKISQIVTSLQSFNGTGANHQWEAVAVADLFAEITALWDIKYAGRGVTLKPDVPSGLRVECRSAELIRAITNILDNAMDALAGTDGGRIDLHASEKDGQVEIRITDSGPRIGAETRESLMNPFYSTKQGTPGAGLGLNVTESIVNCHHGDFFLNAEEGPNTFIIRIPKQQPKETPRE